MRSLSSLIGDSAGKPKSNSSVVLIGVLFLAAVAVGIPAAAVWIGSSIGAPSNQTFYADSE